MGPARKADHAHRRRPARLGARLVRTALETASRALFGPIGHGPLRIGIDQRDPLSLPGRLSGECGARVVLPTPPFWLSGTTIMCAPPAGFSTDRRRPQHQKGYFLYVRFEVRGSEVIGTCIEKYHLWFLIARGPGSRWHAAPGFLKARRHQQVVHRLPVEKLLWVKTNTSRPVRSRSTASAIARQRLPACDFAQLEGEALERRDIRRLGVEVAELEPPTCPLSTRVLAHDAIKPAFEAAGQREVFAVGSASTFHRVCRSKPSSMPLRAQPSSPRCAPSRCVRPPFRRFPNQMRWNSRTIPSIGRRRRARGSRMRFMKNTECSGSVFPARSRIRPGWCSRQRWPRSRRRSHPTGRIFRRTSSPTVCCRTPSSSPSSMLAKPTRTFSPVPGRSTRLSTSSPPRATMRRTPFAFAVAGFSAMGPAPARAARSPASCSTTG